MRLNDRTRIYHMIDAAEAALRLCHGMSQDHFVADERTYRAVFQCIEVIGEAGNHVTDRTRRQPPDVPWHKIKGMRNRLAHTYFDIDVDLVWEVVQKDLPPLLHVLQAWRDDQPETRQP